MSREERKAEYVMVLKDVFLSWRKPPVELPAESVIEDVIDYVMRRELEYYLTGE